MTGELPLDVIENEKGRVRLAPERFKNAEEISQVCNAMVAADKLRAPWRAAIDGLVAGNPTYALSTLRTKGQAWRARVNYRGAEGLLQARQTPFYDLVTEVNPCIEVCLNYGKGVDQTDWANVIAKNFHWMKMKLWRSGFNYHVPLHQLTMLKHGIGYHVWPGAKNCWIPRTPTTGNVLFPDGATLNIEEDLDYFMLRDFLPAHVLYNAIRNEKSASNLGWNVETVWKTLAHASKNKQTSDNRWSPEIFQKEMKAGDIGTTQSRQSGIWLDTLFVKNIENGKIDQYAVAEGMTPNSGRKQSDPFANCLFRKRSRFDEWPLTIFPYDIGQDGDLHTVRGLGARTKDFFELANRVTNAMADQVLTGSLITAQQVGNAEPDKLKLSRIGMMNIIPKDINIVPGLQFPPLAQGPLALLQELYRNVQTNNESYMQGTPEPKDRETAQSFTMRAQNQSQVGKGVHSLYASNYQIMLEREFRTACRSDAPMAHGLSGRLAKKFQEQCFKDGVPREALSHVYEVNEVFSTGAGSAAARIDAMMMLFKYIYPTTTEDRKINIERDFVSAITTSTKTDRYARAQSDNELPGSDASLAVQENNGMVQGGDALVAGEQNHVEHLERHLPKANEIVQAVYAGQMDPAQGLAIIQKFGQHCAEHLQLLQSNPMRKAEFDQFQQEWIALSVIADKLQQQVELNAQAAQQPPPEQQVSDQLQIGLAKTAGNERVGMAKVAADARVNLSRVALEGRIKAIAARNGNGSRPAAARR